MRKSSAGLGLSLRLLQFFKIWVVFQHSEPGTLDERSHPMPESVTFKLQEIYNKIFSSNSVK